MSLIGSLIQAGAGALGGAALGRTHKMFDLGVIANAVTGAVGASVGGQIFGSLSPASGGSVDIAALAGQAAGGGLTGAVVTLVVSVLKKRFFG